MLKQRNRYIDFTKYLLILSVILGHFIQFSKYGVIEATGYWNDYIFRMIYSFHMPLLLAISGYFSFHSIRKQPIQTFLWNRAKYLLIPLLIWCFIKAMVHFALLLEPVTPSIILGYFIDNILHSLWFIWTIILSSFFICLLKKIRLDNIFYLIISSLILKVLPINILCFSSFKDYFIYFIIGYWFATQDLDKYFDFCKRYVFVFIALTIIGIIYWQPVKHYESPLLIEYWTIYFYRIGLSIVSSISFMIIIYHLYVRIKEKKLTISLSNIGQETLGIYLIQDLFFATYGIRFSAKAFPDIQTFLLLLISIIFVLGCYITIKVLEKNRLSSFLLLGKKTY